MNLTALCAFRSECIACAFFLFFWPDEDETAFGHFHFAAWYLCVSVSGVVAAGARPSSASTVDESRSVIQSKIQFNYAIISSLVLCDSADEEDEPRCVQLTNQHKTAIRFIRKVTIDRSFYPLLGSNHFKHDTTIRNPLSQLTANDSKPNTLFHISKWFLFIVSNTIFVFYLYLFSFLFFRTWFSFPTRSQTATADEVFCGEEKIQGGLKTVRR